MSAIAASTSSPAASAWTRMNRLFSNDLEPLRFARDLGLRIVDRRRSLKRLFMAEAAGAGSRAPRLLRGLGL